MRQLPETPAAADSVDAATARPAPSEEEEEEEEVAIEVAEEYEDVEAEEEHLEAVRRAELQALVASLTTPPEDFSDKLSSEFDSLFGDMDMFGHGEQDLQVKAMGDTDAGIDEATMAAARRVM